MWLEGPSTTTSWGFCVKISLQRCGRSYAYSDFQDFSFRGKKNQAFGISVKVQFFDTILYWCSMNTKHTFFFPQRGKSISNITSHSFAWLKLEEDNTSKKLGKEDWSTGRFRLLCYRSTALGELEEAGLYDTDRERSLPFNCSKCLIAAAQVLGSAFHFFRGTALRKVRASRYLHRWNFDLFLLSSFTQLSHLSNTQIS